MAKTKQNNCINSVHEMIPAVKNEGTIQLYVDDKKLSRRTIHRVAKDASLCDYQLSWSTFFR